jgi:hypothetical protein
MIKYLIAWLILALGIASFFAIGSWPLYRLATRGISVQGAAIEFLPQIHRTLRYGYKVGSNTFQGQVAGAQIVESGDPIMVCYDPQRPSVSVIGDPNAQLENQLIAAFLVILVAPTFIVARFAWWLRRRGKILISEGNMQSS